MLSKPRTWWWVAGGLAAVVLLVPLGVEWWLDGELRRRLDRRGVEADWEAVDWFWTDTVTLRRLEMNGGPVEGATIDEVSVDIGVLSPIIESAAIDAVRMRGVEVTASVDRLVDGAQGSAPRGAEGVRGGAAELSRLSDVGALDVRDLTVALRRSGAVVARVEGDGRVEPALGGGREAAGSGRVTVGGAGASAVDWSFDGTVGPTFATLDGQVGLAGPEASADIDIGPVRLGLAGMAVDIDRRDLQASTLRLTEPFLRVAEGERAGLAVTAPRLDLRFDTEAALHVRGRKLAVATAPRVLLDRLTDGGGAAESSAGDEPSASSLLPLARLRDRLVSSVDVTFEQTTLRVDYRAGEGWKRLKPSEAVGVRKRGRRLEVAGGFAGGWAAGRAAWEPGSMVPSFGTIRVDGVDLEQVPVVRQGRSLPNRGVRGKIGGRVDLDGSFVRTGHRGTLRERMTGLLDFRWRDGWAQAGGLAGEPVEGIDTSVKLSVDFQPQLNRLRLRDSSVGWGPLRARLDGSIEDWPMAPTVEFRARAEEFDCHRAVRSLPDTLLGPYREATLEEKAKPTFRFQIPVDRPRDLTIDLEGFPGKCRVTGLHTLEEGWPTLEFPEPTRPKRPTNSDDLIAMLKEAAGRVPTATRSKTRYYAAAPDPTEPLDPPAELAPVPADWNDQKPDDVFWLKRPFVKRVTEGVSEEADVRIGPGLDSYVPLEAMPTYVGGASYLSEEINFYDDGGWNIHLIQKALQLNFQEHRFVYGGSTVTQQLVKNLFLTRDKTLARKIQEALIAWRIQGVVSKDRVLELYLNAIEYGEDLYGIGPAARHYFQKEAADLTILEAVFLAVIKPAPWYGDKFVERGETPDKGWWYDRIEQIIERLVQKGFITKEQAEEARPYVLKWDEDGRAVSR
jgi:hypothetical protein